MNITVPGFKIAKLIGKGSFGQVYVGQREADDRLVSIKIEQENKKNILKHEHKIYNHIINAYKASKPRIPAIHWFGKIENKTVMVMDYLGNSLDFLFTYKCQGKFTPKTTLMVAIQLIDLISTLHSCGIIHRDIKPDNFLMGIGDNAKKIYLIDFGLAKEFKRKSHIKEMTGKSLVGTARYASINSHNGLELSRRDDLESIGYMLIYFYKGLLPWQGISEKDRSKKYVLIGKMKEQTPLSALCKGLPKIYYDYMSYVRSLSFRDKPDYSFVRNLFVNEFLKHKFVYNNFDWEIK